MNFTQFLLTNKTEIKQYTMPKVGFSKIEYMLEVIDATIIRGIGEHTEEGMLIKKEIKAFMHDLKHGEGMVITPHDEAINRQWLFHGIVLGSSTDNIHRLTKDMVFCASNVPLGMYGIYGEFDILAHFSEDAYSDIVGGGCRMVEGHNRIHMTDSSIDVLGNIMHCLDVVASNSHTALLQYDEALCRITDTPYMCWYNDYKGAVPIEGYRPLSELVEEHRRYVIQLVHELAI